MEEDYENKLDNEMDKLFCDDYFEDELCVIDIECEVNESTCVDISDEIKELEKSCCVSPNATFSISDVLTPSTPNTPTSITTSTLTALPISFEKKKHRINDQQYKELVEMPVKEFNKRIKMLSIDKETVSFLKLERKRNKNREAAIRSRAKKDQYVVKLEQTIEELRKQNLSNLELIRELKDKIGKLEASCN